MNITSALIFAAFVVAAAWVMYKIGQWNSKK